MIWKNIPWQKIRSVIWKFIVFVLVLNWVGDCSRYINEAKEKNEGLQRELHVDSRNSNTAAFWAEYARRQRELEDPDTWREVLIDATASKDELGEMLDDAKGLHDNPGVVAIVSKKLGPHDPRYLLLNTGEQFIWAGKIYTKK